MKWLPSAKKGCLNKLALPRQGRKGVAALRLLSGKKG